MDFSLTSMFFKKQVKIKSAVYQRVLKPNFNQKVGMTISKTIKSSELLNIL